MHCSGKLTPIKDGDEIRAGIGRDPSGAIVNTDSVSFAQHRAAKQAKIKEQNELAAMRSEIDQLRGVVQELVSFLKSTK